MSIFEKYQELNRLEVDTTDYEYFEDTGSPLDAGKEGRQNFFYLYLLVSLLFFILAFRLTDLQIIQGLQNKYLSERNRIGTREIVAMRGVIYDRAGKKLVKNVPAYSLIIYPASLPRQKEDAEKIFNSLLEVPEIDKEKVESLRNDYRKQGLPIVLKENIKHEEAIMLQVKLANLQGVQISKNALREYLPDASLSHLLGYIGKINDKELKESPNYKMTDRIGKAGLEKTYEAELRGRDGREQQEVDSQGRIQRILSTINPIEGYNLKLALDYDLQKFITEVLNKKLEETKNNQAVAIAIDPRDGGILSMVSIPSYDNNLFAKGISAEDYKKLTEDSSNPLINRAILGLYPPGSTIKPVMAAAGLEEKVINQKTVYDDQGGKLQIGEWAFPDWKVHGLTDVKKAIAESCDVFFYIIGGGWEKFPGLGIDRINDYFKRFGLGKKTGIDLNGEAEGLVPDDEWKRKVKKEKWYIGDTYHVSIGQGDLLVTPLQIVNTISAIANGGTLYQPHLAQSILDPAGQEIKKIDPKVLNKEFVSQDVLRIVREGMRQTVTDGSARQLKDLPVDAAGKTGTAQFGADEKTHSWFVSFAPFENPEIATVVLVEGGGEGNELAVPITKDILNYYFTRPK